MSPTGVAEATSGSIVTGYWVDGSLRNFIAGDRSSSCLPEAFSSTVYDTCCTFVGLPATSVWASHITNGRDRQAFLPFEESETTSDPSLACDAASFFNVRGSLYVGADFGAALRTTCVANPSAVVATTSCTVELS